MRLAKWSLVSPSKKPPAQGKYNGSCLNTERKGSHRFMEREQKKVFKDHEFLSLFFINILFI